MSNKEKYIDVIIEDMFGGCCDNKVIRMVIGECDESMNCTECFDKVVRWLNEEYVEESGTPIFYRKFANGKVVCDATNI